jgi:hypothetical protein
MGHIEKDALLPLPAPYDVEPPARELDSAALAQLEASLDDTLAVGVPQPSTPQEEEELVRRFLSGLEKLLSRKTTGLSCNRSSFPLTTAPSARLVSRPALFIRQAGTTPYIGQRFGAKYSGAWFNNIYAPEGSCSPG